MEARGDNPMQPDYDAVVYYEGFDGGILGRAGAQGPRGETDAGGCGGQAAVRGGAGVEGRGR
eukprot:7354387-Lingulodinium_polyedra.AAC.1